MAAAQDAEATFKAVGLNPKMATAVVKNAALSAAFLELIQEAGVSEGCDRSIGNMLYALVSNGGADLPNRGLLIDLIKSGDVKSDAQVKAGMVFLRQQQEPSVQGLKTACGVGVEYTEGQIDEAIQALFVERQADLEENRHAMLGELLALLRERLAWVNGKMLKDQVEAALVAKFGAPAEAAEKGKKKKAPKAKKEQAIPEEAKEAGDAAAAAPAVPAVAADAEDVLLEGRTIEWARNTPDQMKGHRERTGGKVMTRFPPEPNGYLHIGHAKAMFFNFKIANDHGGECLLRFDDTNPEAEEQEFIDSIIDNVHWMGHQPSKITYSSDYFQELYELAVKLTKKGLAYVCHQTAEEIKQSRKDHTDSPWRDRPIEESLKLFEDMRMGKFEEGKAILRMKGDMKHPNPQMWDMIAYRIKYTAHPRTGDKWCVYPSYDFTHCIVDSLEDITHSLCTLEFEVRRESYFWLLWELDLYKPRVWEYSRLNISNTVLSKRKLKHLVANKDVSGWDDPRLLTLNGLRRRGYTAEVITEFCKKIGVSRNDNVIRMDLLEHCARDQFNAVAPRAMVVSDPLEVELVNMPADAVEKFAVPDFPADPDSPTHEVPLTRRLWIERTDFQMQPDKKFFGLGPGRTAHLKYAFNVTVQEVVTAPEDPTKPILLRCVVNRDSPEKCKGKLHWVAEPAPGVAPLKVQLNLYSGLFQSDNPDNHPDGWLADLNPDSLVVIPDALADPSVAKAQVSQPFQFERLAYFSLDRACVDQPKLVFNRVVELKASKAKREIVA